MKELVGFIEEIKHNIEVNEEHNLEQSVNLIYVYERLSDILIQLIIEKQNEELQNK